MVCHDRVTITTHNIKEPECPKLYTITMWCGLEYSADVPAVGFTADYPDGSNSSEYLVQPTTYLPENFTYAQNLPCPERLPSMSEYTSTLHQEIIHSVLLKRP